MEKEIKQKQIKKIFHQLEMLQEDVTAHISNPQITPVRRPRLRGRSLT